GDIRDLAGQQKRRFLSISQSLDSGIEQDYRNAIVAGLLGEPESAHSNAEELSISEITELISPFGGTQDATLAKSICWGMKRRSANMPEAWILIALDFALHHPDPETPEDDRSIRSNISGTIANHDYLTNGINHARGVAVGVLAKALFANHDCAEQIRQSIPLLIADPSLGVRACLIELLTAWLNIDRAEATDWFIQLVEGHDNLLHSPSIEGFLFYACQTHRIQLSEILIRMANQSDGGAREIGVKQSVRNALIDREWRTSAKRFLSHQNFEVRKYVAEVAVEAWVVTDFRSFAEELLRVAFFDFDDQVREAAARVFQQVENDSWVSIDSLAREFVVSPAFLSAAETFFWNLEDSNPIPQELVVFTAQNALKEWRESVKKLGEIEKLRWSSKNLSKLVLCAYTNTTSPEVRSACLDLIDEFLAEGFYGISELINDSS
ncbi:MAG: hypothetical protein GXP30_09990, partial [Verrucomicrobia bacterium]|nr:hypothetical protein [Verrucomicrobiota bacterium]